MLAALLSVMGAAAGLAMGADYVVNEPSDQRNGGHDLQSNDTLTVNANITYGGDVGNGSGAVFTAEGVANVTVTVAGVALQARYGVASFGTGHKFYFNGATLTGTTNDAINDGGIGNYYRIDGGTLTGATGSVWSHGSGSTFEIVNGATIHAAGNNSKNFACIATNTTIRIVGKVGDLVTIKADGNGTNVNDASNFYVDHANFNLRASYCSFDSKVRNIVLDSGGDDAQVTIDHADFTVNTYDNIYIGGTRDKVTLADCALVSNGSQNFYIRGTDATVSVKGTTLTANGYNNFRVVDAGANAVITLDGATLVAGANPNLNLSGANAKVTAKDSTFTVGNAQSALISGANTELSFTDCTVQSQGADAFELGGAGTSLTISNGMVATNGVNKSAIYLPASANGANVRLLNGAELHADNDGGDGSTGIWNTAVNTSLVVASGANISAGRFGISNRKSANGGLIAVGKGSAVTALIRAQSVAIEMLSAWNSLNLAGTVAGKSHSLHVAGGDSNPRGNVFNLMDGAVIAASTYGLKNERSEVAYTSYLTFGYAPGANPNANDWMMAAGTGIGDGALAKVDNNANIVVNDAIVGANAGNGNRWVAYVAAGTTSFNANSDIRETYIGAEGFAPATLIAAADGPLTATRIVPVAGAKAKLIIGENALFRAIDKLYIYTGGTLQIDGTLDAQNVFAVDGGALTVNGTATAQKALAVTDGTVTVAGTLGVTEALTLVNAQTTVAAGGTLNAPASLDAIGGAITVDGALNAANELFLRGTTLTVNGTLTPPATLNLLNGATLRGTGTVIGDVTTAGQGGRIAPGGAAAGTLTFAGSLTVAAGDALALRAGDGGTDKVAVNGALTLASGSQVTVTPNGGSQAGAVYTLATAGGGLDDQGASKTVDSQSALLDYAFREDANSLMLAVSAKPGVYQEIAAEAGDKADAGFAAALDQLTVAHPPALDEVFAALNQMTDRREVAAAMRQLSAASGLGAATGVLAAQRHNAAMGRYFGDTFARDVALRMVAGGGAFQPQGARFGAIPGRQAPAVYETASVIHGAPTAPAAPNASAGALDVPMPADFDPTASRGPLAAPFGDAAPGAAARELPAREWQGDGAGASDSRDDLRREPVKKGDKRAQAGGAPAALPDGPEPVEPAPEPRWNGFLVAAGSFGEQSHGGGVAGYSHKGVGALVGLERGFDANLTGGFQVGWARHVADIDDGLGEVDDDVVRFGAHARWQNERFFALSTPSAAVHMLESERNIAFLGRTAKGERTGFDLSWFNQAGVAVEAPHGFYLLPTASLALTWMHDPAYREGGAAAAELTLDAHDRWSLNSTLALRVGRPFQLAGLVVNPEIMGGWEHEYFEEGSVGCAFAAAPAVGWRVPVAAPARDRALLGASLTTLVRDRWEISARYEGRLWDGGHEHAFTVAVEFGF